MNAHNLRAYFEQLTHYLTWQDERMSELERQLVQLRRELNELKEQRSVRIERIEYKFDQLKIEKLEGQLHIGLSPEGAQSIEQLVTGGQGLEGSEDGFAVHKEVVTVGPPAGDPMSAGAVATDSAIQDIRTSAAERVAAYLAKDCADDIAAASNRLNMKLDEDYIDLMVDDLRRQVDARIRHYARAGIVSGHDPADDSLADAIASRVIRDIQAAVKRHLNAKNGGNSEGEIHHEDDRRE